VLICPEAPSSQMLSRLTRTWMALVTSFFGAHGRLSTGAKASALSLLTRTSFHIIEPRPLTARFGVLALLVLAVALGHTARDQLWSIYSFLARLRDGTIKSPMGQCARCAEAAVAQISSLSAALIVSSFRWSCFRWRWLWHIGPTRARAWTDHSFFGGMLFLFPIYALVQFIEHIQFRYIGADREDFRKRQIYNCLMATWCTSCVYIVLWIMSEILMALEKGEPLRLR
jgi:hypothetical protein